VLAEAGDVDLIERRDDDVGVRGGEELLVVSSGQTERAMPPALAACTPLGASSTTKHCSGVTCAPRRGMVEYPSQSGSIDYGGPLVVVSCLRDESESAAERWWIG